MAKVTSADSLIAEISEAIRRELLDGIAPIVRRIAEAAGDLEAAIGGKKRGRPAGKRGPGRPAKAKRGRPAKGKPGRPPKAKRGRPAKVKLGRPKGSGKKGTRTPKGAMKTAILGVLEKSGAPMKLTAIRDAILQQPIYRGRNKTALYTQIVITIQKLPEVARTPKGEYALKGKK